MDILEVLTGSKSRAEIFRLLFENPEQELYLRELQRRSGLSVRPVQEEVGRLIEAGLLKSRKDGNRLYFSSNTEHPLYSVIRQMVEKTSGAEGLLREALRDAEIRFAFIFGSIASDQARPDSDLDLFVIGSLGLRKLSRLISGLSVRIGREINPHVMSPAEFGQRLDKKDHFVSRVMESPKKLLIGDENELRALGSKRVA